MPLTVSDHPRLRRRRAAVLIATALAPAALVHGLGHRGVHMARSLLVPGAGLYDEHLWLGIGLTCGAALATYTWMRWGLDWVLAVVLAAAVAISGVVIDPDVHTAGAATAPVLASRAAHEFPLVLVVVGAITWLRIVVRRTPGIAALLRRRATRRRGMDDLAVLPPYERARAVTIATLVGDPDLIEAVASWDRPDVDRRCAAIDRWARGRSPRRAQRHPADHAPVRAARAAQQADGDARRALVAAAGRSPWAAPCTEPGWLRPVDATLAALVMARGGRPDSGDVELAARWARTLEHEFALRRGHRPAWCWAPLGVAAGAMTPWEHATVAALAHHAGWLHHHDDWVAVRRAALGAAARPDRDAHDERLVAAGRWLAHLAGDIDALRILHRAHLRLDPLALALDRLARSVLASDVTHPPEGHLVR